MVIATPEKQVNLSYTLKTYIIPIMIKVDRYIYVLKICQPFLLTGFIMFFKFFNYYSDSIKFITTTKCKIKCI